MLKRLISIVLSLALTGLAAGLEPYQALAATVAPKVRVNPVGSVKLNVAVPGQAGLPKLTVTPGLSPSLTPNLGRGAITTVIPSVNPVPAANVTPFEQSMTRLQAETLIPAGQAETGDALQEGAQADFEQRVGLEGTETATNAASNASVSPDASLPKAGPVKSAKKKDKAAKLVAREKREARSPYFPAAVAAAFAALGGAFIGLNHLFIPAASSADGVTPVSVIGLAALAGGAVAGLVALVDAAVFAFAVWRGRKVTDEQFTSFVRSEVLAGRLDGGVGELIKAHRPTGKLDLDFGYAAGGRVYLRPELIATPLLFRSVLLHELRHVKERKTRGPPRGRFNALIRGLTSELKARAAEFGGVAKLKGIRVPVLERVLRQAQVSLNLGHPYDLLVVNAGSPELSDPELYKKLSGGAARVESAKTEAPQDLLGKTENHRRYGAVVLDKPFELLPGEGTAEAVKLDLALKQLDSLYLLATRMTAQGSAFAEGSSEQRRFQELAAKAARVNSRDSRQLQNFEKAVRGFWRQIAGDRLKDVRAAEFVDKLYSGMKNKGTAFLSFGPADPGVTTWERLLRFWEAEDGGQFRVTRVDLENGSHVLILRKVESRVGMWLRPQNGGRVAKSLAFASATEEGRAAARAAMLEAGLEKELDKLDKLDVEVRHVFGADVGRQEIYVTIPRRFASAMRGLAAGSSITIAKSEMFGVEGTTPVLHDVKPLWRLGVTGKGAKIMWIDTGADASHEDMAGRLEVLDMVGEGPEDWMGHGSHVAGISIARHDKWMGVAYEAQGIMAKVFSRDAAGATDGDIMAAGVLAVQRGVQVINLSLGSKGSSSDNLAMFFTELGRKNNIFVTASQGNSGPFNSTGSQPAQGEGVFATAAGGLTAKGERIVRFFSSVGPDVDQRYSIRRLRLKPNGVVNGGNVTTRPGSRDVYEEGVTSTKSKDSPKSASDTEDGRHTRLSGTSMASPGLGAIAALIMLLGLSTPFYEKHKALVVGALLERSAEHMGLPPWHQGPGWITAWGAAKLVLGEAGVKVRRFLRGQPQADPWDWVERVQNVVSLEDTVYSASEVARSQAESRFDDGALEDSETPPEAKQAAKQALNNEVRRQFNESAAAALPKLLEALKDPIWMVRRQAALALLNLKLAASDQALAETALNDEDPRVRQMAYLALGELNIHSSDILLKQAAANEVFAAYALARRGDRSEIHRIAAALSSEKLSERYTAIWLLGQISRRLTGEDSEKLSARLKDAGEDGEAKHLAAAALFNIAGEQPAALSDRVILDLLETAGPQNLALTRTIAKVFPAAAQNRAFAARLREAPLKQPVADWVYLNRAAVMRPGALGEMVALLARLAGIQLDAPTPQPNPSGQGVPGVDPAFGPVDVLVTPAAGKTLDAAWFAAFEAKLNGRAGDVLLISVPEHKLFALSLNLRQAGHAARPSQPLYPAAKSEVRNGGGLTVSRSEGLVKITAHTPVSEASVMEALLPFAGQPVVISLSAVPAGPAPALVQLINRLVLTGTGVVVPAGNQGPSAGSVTPLSRSLALVVADNAFYSGRGLPEAHSVAWTDNSQGAGSGLAAERTAEKLAALAGKLGAALGSLPAGWFQYAASAARRSLSALPGEPHVVGAGLYDKQEAALGDLEFRLKTPETALKDIAELAEALKKRAAESQPQSPARALGAAAQALVKNGTQALRGLAADDVPAAGWASSAPLKELKLLMGDGAAGVAPFSFKLETGWWAARDAGLEGFLYTKLEVERRGTRVEQLPDYFKYLDALLAAFAWAAPLRGRLNALEKADVPAYEKNARLNALLVEAVRELRAAHAASDAAAWGRRNATYMIFSRAYNRLKPGKDFFESLDDAELLRVKNELAATEIWLMDIFEIGELRRWGTGGGSSYSIKGYIVKEQLGGREGMKAFVERAHKLGLKVKVDFIPNHTSLDSRMIKDHPEAFLHVVPPEHLTDEEVLAGLPRETGGEKYPFYYLVRANDGKRYLIHHPRTDFGEVMWVDLAQIDYSHPVARGYQTQQLKSLFLDLGVDSARRDMAYEVVNDRYYHRWKTIINKELDAPQADWMRQATVKMLEDFLERGKNTPEFLEDATDAVKAAKPTAVMIDEVYANLESVSRTGSDGLYDKIGLYDALVSRDAGRIRGALRRSAFKRWQRGAAPYVNFVGTHDGGEGNPFDKFGRQFQAAAATALLLRPILLYNGVEQGVGQRENVIGELEKSVDRDKALPFDIPVQINWANANPQNQKALQDVLTAGSRNEELLDLGAMEVLEPTGDTPITAFSVGQGAGRRALIVAANWSDGPASGIFKFDKPVLKSFGSFQPERGKRYALKDLLGGAVYERLGSELIDSGLYTQLKGGGAHIFEVTEIEAAPTTGPPSNETLSKAAGASHVKSKLLAVDVEAPDQEAPAPKPKPKRDWDYWTSWLASKAAWVFMFLQVPQFLTNIVNLSEKYPVLSPLAGLISDAPGKVQLISSLPWMGYSTGILANMLLLGYFAGKKEGAGAFVQAIGVVTSALVVTQIFLAGFMPLWAFALVMPTIIAGLTINFLAYKGKLPEKVGKWWGNLSSSLGLFVLPQAVLSAFMGNPLLPGLLATGALFAAMWKFPRFKQLVSALTATALFMYGPVAQIISNVQQPQNMAGIAVLSLMLGMLGNLLMLPRALHTKDWIWFTGSAWGVALGGWATMLCMYLAGYLGAALFWPVTLLIPAYLAFAYNKSKQK